MTGVSNGEKPSMMHGRVSIESFSNRYVVEATTYRIEE